MTTATTTRKKKQTVAALPSSKRDVMDPWDCIQVFPHYDPHRDSEDFEFIPERAYEKIEWIEENIVHTEGPLAGKPYFLEPHQLGMQYMLWGWFHRVEGYRRIKEALYYCSRKGSKSTDCAVILNTIIFTEPDHRMQIYGCASAERQSQKVFNIMKAQVGANEEMARRVRVYKQPASIQRLVDESTYLPLPDNADVEHGANVRACLCDEIHTYKSAALPIVMRTGMIAQKEPLMLYATTADYLRPSFCNDRLDYGKKVRDGVVRNPRFLPMIYEPSEERLREDPDYWQKEECWREANPMFGIVIPPEAMREECDLAIADPSYQNEFKRLLCNIRTEVSESMIEAERWALNDGVFPPGHFAGRTPLAVFLDCSSTSDATSLNLLFEHPVEGYEAVWYHWMPRAKADHYERTYSKPYSVWEREGWITLTEGDQIHYDRIRDEIVAICTQYGIRELSIDPLFQAIQLAQQLEEAGIKIEYFKCNMTNMTAPTGEALRFINSGLMKHGNNAFMREQAGNAVLSRRKELMMPDKAKSTGKIDGIVALIGNMATALLKRKPKGSVYETRGFISFGKD